MQSSQGRRAGLPGRPALTPLAEILPAIFGCRGTRLTDDERALFAEHPPLGLILFKRNISSSEQVIDLVQSFKCVRGEGPVLILVDQEGGRVARLGPPEWPKMAPAGFFGRLAQTDRAAAEQGIRLHGALIAAELAALGINVDCAPVLDLDLPGADAIISDRAFGEDPGLVADLGRIQADALLAGGCLPVMKHIPGHGRARVDSHRELPVVTASATELEQSDFLPFRKNRDLPLAMTAHIVYKAFDERPATLSTRVIRDVIRGQIGFRGLLMSDDLAMQALSGTMTERAAGAQEAGIDILLHCDGSFKSMDEISSSINNLPDETKVNLEKLLNSSRPTKSPGREALRAEYDDFLAQHG